jgi:hypothetical protein
MPSARASRAGSEGGSLIYSSGRTSTEQALSVLPPRIDVPRLPFEGVPVAMAMELGPTSSQCIVDPSLQSIPSQAYTTRHSSAIVPCPPSAMFSYVFSPLFEVFVYISFWYHSTSRNRPSGRLGPRHSCYCALHCSNRVINADMACIIILAVLRQLRFLRALSSRRPRDSSEQWPTAPALSTDRRRITQRSMKGPSS